MADFKYVILGKIVDSSYGFVDVLSSKTGKIYHFVLNNDEWYDKFKYLERSGKERYFVSNDGVHLDYEALDMGFTIE